MNHKIVNSIGKEDKLRSWVFSVLDNLLWWKKPFEIKMFNSIFGLFMAMLLLLLTSRAQSELDSTLPINQNSTDSLFGKFSQCTTMLKPYAITIFWSKITSSRDYSKP